MGLTITFSRHALRRMQLYKVEESDVVETINSTIAEEQVSGKKREIVNKELAKKYRFPLKVIFAQENDKILVITVYPLRKERKS